MQYSIRLRHEPDITLAEYYRLLNGIMPETPLGQVVSVRYEKDHSKVKRFTAHEHKIRRGWNDFKSKRTIKEMPQEEWDKKITGLQSLLSCMFSKGGV